MKYRSHCDMLTVVTYFKTLCMRCWLAEHHDVTDFVVIDDEFMGADFMNSRFVKTSNYTDGLEEKDVINVIEILNSLT